MHKKTLNFNFLATGIGSVPFLDIEDTCFNILQDFSGLPFWPQFVKRKYLEDMNIQYSEGLPMLKIIEESRRLVAVSSEDKDSDMISFYDRFMAEDIDYFAISKEYAPGLYKIVEAVRQDPEKYGDYIKGQTVGPITFAAAITDHEGKSVLYNPEFLDIMVKGISIKALWQVRELSKSGKKTIIFLDEPYLASYGSAFSSIQRHEVIYLLKEVVDYLKKRSDTLIGIHCCGNTDWAIIVEAAPDIISFDAFDYMDHFLLYSDDIIRFLGGGGALAWGIVPTSSSWEDESPEDLSSRLEKGLNRLDQWGIDLEIITERSIITPACGMGTMIPDTTRNRMKMLKRLSDKFVKKVPYRA